LINRQVKPEEAFILKDGRVLNSLAELRDNLHSIGDDLFFHHVSNTRSDFANWARHVHRDKRLADNLESAKTQLDVYKTITRRQREHTHRARPLKKLPEAMIIKMDDGGKKEMKITIEGKTTKKKYGANMLIPKGGFKDNFTPFVHQEKIDYEKLRYKTDEEIGSKKKRICQQEHLRHGLNDFVKGIIFGVIVGILLALI